MAIYAISFRIGKTGDDDLRYKSLVERIERNTVGLSFDDTTSFYVLESSKTTEELKDDLYHNSSMRTEYDMLVVINLDKNEYATAGTFVNPRILQRLMTRRTR